MNFLPILLNSVIHIFTKLSWKTAFFVALVCIVYLVFQLYMKNEELRDSSSAKEQLRSENERLKAENDDSKPKSDVHGLNTEQHTFIRREASDFDRDWNTSDFDVDGDTFCPKDKGRNKFQRMFYKYDTPFAASDLSLKFRMVNQYDNVTNYTQRVVVGMQLDEAVFSEYDVPTRNSQVVNFRVASENGELVSGGEGKPISSPIKDKSTINLRFQTKLKHGQETTQIIGLDYVSAVDEYGEESKSISYDAKVNDARPETTRANIFIGSYMGGCIKIIDWHAS